MPGSYAHYRFGKLLYAQLPADCRPCVQRFRRMYDVGLQGPDIFFYYNPLWKTTVGTLGHQLHSKSGQHVFTQACQAASSEAARAYLYGLLAHYTLDAVCHPYVNRVEHAGEARHVALESEFDRFLMTMDGKPTPHTYCIKDHLKLTRGECMTVAAFYPPATGASIHQSVGRMRGALSFLAGGNRAKREKLLKRIRPSLLDSLVPEKEEEGFRRMDRELLARFERAMQLYPVLLRQLQEHMRTGEPLGADFSWSFDKGMV